MLVETTMFYECVGADGSNAQHFTDRRMDAARNHCVLGCPRWSCALLNRSGLPWFVLDRPRPFWVAVDLSGLCSLVLACLGMFLDRHEPS